jgi:hypothetical protein
MQAVSFDIVGPIALVKTQSPMLGFNYALTWSRNRQQMPASGDLQVEEGLHQCSQLIVCHSLDVRLSLRCWHRLLVVIDQHESPRLRIESDVRACGNSWFVHMPRRRTDATCALIYQRDKAS